MAQVGTPESRSLLQALQQVAMEATLIERKRCADIASTGCLVHPDGGSPTEAEIAMRDDITTAILSR